MEDSEKESLFAHFLLYLELPLKIIEMNGLKKLDSSKITAMKTLKLFKISILLLLTLKDNLLLKKKKKLNLLNLPPTHQQVKVLPISELSLIWLLMQWVKKLNTNNLQNKKN